LSDVAADLVIADQAADRLTTIDPDGLLTLRARGNVLRAQGDWPAAEVVVRRALAMQPTEASRHYELGYILMAEGRHQEAMQSFRNAKRFAGGTDRVSLFNANIAVADLAIGQFVDRRGIGTACPKFKSGRPSLPTRIYWTVSEGPACLGGGLPGWPDSPCVASNRGATATDVPEHGRRAAGKSRREALTDPAAIS